MGKISIGLRGWRFDESDVFTEDGEFRPLEEVPPEPRQRLLRLAALTGGPCDACWLIHGDENVERCNVSAVVYGEPLGEVTLCAEHESDFYYWFSEAGGDAYRGERELKDAFHEWFLDGGRAPEGYGGPEHVDTDPDAIPDPLEVDLRERQADLPDAEQEVDLRDAELDLSTDYPS